MTAPVYFFCEKCNKVVQDVSVSQPDIETLAFKLKCHGDDETHLITASLILGDPNPLWSSAFKQAGPEYSI